MVEAGLPKAVSSIKGSENRRINIGEIVGRTNSPNWSERHPAKRRDSHNQGIRQTTIATRPGTTIIISIKLPATTTCFIKHHAPFASLHHGLLNAPGKSSPERRLGSVV